MNLDEKNVNSATNNLPNAINSVLNKYAPHKKANKYKLRFKERPWMTSCIQKSVYVKNKISEKFINKKYKAYMKLLSTLIKQSKQIYYTKYFGNNWNNIKNNWKGNNLD